LLAGIGGQAMRIPDAPPARAARPPLDSDRRCRCSPRRHDVDEAAVLDLLRAG
jgi:hypothetical protein